MIKHLLEPSFLQYGTIENTHPLPEDGINCAAIAENAEIPLYRYPFPTYWSHHSGMVGLLIEDNGKQMQFYLDRTVKIHPNVLFGFYALEAEGSIAGDAALQRTYDPVTQIDIHKDLYDPSAFRMYTLFRQEASGGLFFRGEEHTPLELVYVEKGELHNFCDGEKYVLRPKQLQIFGPKQWHMQYADEDVRFLTLSFTWEGHDFSPLFNRTFTIAADLQYSIQSLLRAYDQDGAGRDEFLHIQTQLLLLQILRMPTQSVQRKQPSPASELSYQRTIDKAMQAVAEHVYERLSVAELAALVNVSASQLTFLFRHYLNITPAKYMTRVRLEESKMLLTERKASVGEVAAQLGYASIQHFSKQFHDWYGYSPSAYVRQDLLHRSHPQ